MPVDGYAHCGQEKYLPVESLEAVMRASSVERAVLCQHLGQYDNSYLASLVESQPDRFAGIALIDHRASSWEEELATVVATGFRGLRITSEALREEAELAPAAAAAGLIPVIYAPEGIRDLVSQLGETAAARPQVPIIVSHLGNPLVDRDRLQHGEELLDLASEPNILVLLSGLHMFCGFPVRATRGARRSSGGSIRARTDHVGLQLPRRRRERGRLPPRARAHPLGRPLGARPAGGDNDQRHDSKEGLVLMSEATKPQETAEEIHANIIRVVKPDEPGLTPAAAARLLLELETIRRAEEWLLEHEELVHGPVHSSIGQEGVAVGATAALLEGDAITSTHRAHHHVLSKTMAHYGGPTYDPLVDPLPEAVRRCVTRTIAEILGLPDGWAGGRGGSMHLIDLESGVAGTTAIVGGGIPIAAGLAYAGSLADPVQVAVAFLGDGAASIGAFHEGLSMARVWNLPAIFLVENNLYSVATTVEETVGFTDIVLRAAGQDMLGIVVDGMDTLAVREAVRRARAHASAGRGPVLIEAKTYRYRHQNGKLPGSAFRYRTRRRRPNGFSATRWRARPRRRGARAARRRPRSSTCGLRPPRSSRRPPSASTRRARGPGRRSALSGRPARPTQRRGVRGDLSEFDGVPVGPPGGGVEVETIRYSAAISRTLARALEREPRAFILGEEVSHLGGGAYGSTKDALRVAPDRVLSTPIAENGFSGVALGAATRRPTADRRADVPRLRARGRGPALQPHREGPSRLRRCGWPSRSSSARGRRRDAVSGPSTAAIPPRSSRSSRAGGSRHPRRRRST